MQSKPNQVAHSPDKKASWKGLPLWLLVVGGIISGGVALSLHVFVLQVLHIDTPAISSPTGVMGWVIRISTYAAVLSLCHFALPSAPGKSVLARTLVIFVLFQMFSEQVFRLPIMNGVVSQSFAYPILAGLISLIPGLISYVVAGQVAARLRSWWKLAIAAVVLAPLLALAVRPPLTYGMGLLMQKISFLQQPDIYDPPYDWHVLVPAYATYAEPVIGCLCLAALMWKQLSPRFGVRLLQFALVMLFARGMVLIPISFVAAVQPDQRLIALVAIGQFILESALLAVLSGVTFEMANRARLRATPAQADAT